MITSGWQDRQKEYHMWLLGRFKKECLNVQAVGPAFSGSIHTIELSTVSKADWRKQLYSETLKSRDKDAAETAQAEENFNSITENLEGKLLMMMEI